MEAEMMPHIFKNRRTPFLLIIPLLIMIIVPAICFADAEKVFRENNKAVVVVIAYDEAGEAISLGSGFIVRQDGVIITNHHVIKNSSRIIIKVGDKVINVEGLIYR
jgi:S1-C subfamily serine protease